MSDLRDPLDDLLADVPTYVVPDARSAWAAGSRRRTRRRIAIGAVAAVVIAVVASAVSWLPRVVEPQPASNGGVGAYPTRVDYPYWSPTLGDDPEQLAAVLQRVDERDTYDQPLGWYGVGTSGRLWRIDGPEPADYPALSPDGRQLAYFNRSSTNADVLDFEILHLADGSSSSVSIGSAHADETAFQFPSFWSPDSGRILVTHAGQGRAIVFGSDGSDVRRLRTGIPAWPAGWIDDGSIAWLRLGDNGHGAVVITDLDGNRLRSVPLDLPEDRAYFGQWAGTVSADGSRIALVSDPDLEVRVFSMATGDQVGDPISVPNVDQTCTTSWAGDEVRVPVSGDDGVLLADAAGQPKVMADPRLGGRCSQWASSAVSGDARGGIGGAVFGTSNSWVSWHWRELLLIATVAAIALVAVRRIRRRRVHRLG